MCGGHLLASVPLVIHGTVSPCSDCQCSLVHLINMAQKRKWMLLIWGETSTYLCGPTKTILMYASSRDPPSHVILLLHRFTIFDLVQSLSSEMDALVCHAEPSNGSCATSQTPHSSDARCQLLLTGRQPAEYISKRKDRAPPMAHIMIRELIIAVT